MDSTSPPAVPAPVASVHVERWLEGVRTVAADDVADEQPIAFKYHGVSHVVMLATPHDLQDLAIGFTLSEAIVESPAEIREVRVHRAGEALEVHLDIAPERFTALLQRHRHLTGRTGCGMCGAETLSDAIRAPKAQVHGVTLSSADVQLALQSLGAWQTMNARTGSIHGAAWAVPGQGVVLVREDVGRHNAMDKLIGALVQGGFDLASGYVIITSRASYEIVQKAATVGISALVAVSAPTAFAIRSADAFGVTLIGFARPGRHVIYAHGERVVA